MLVGDLVFWGHLPWLVRRIDREQGLAEVLSCRGDIETIPWRLERAHPDQCRVLCHPGTDWCVVATPVRAGRGPVVRVVVAQLEGNLELVPFRDWVSSDPTREGGPVFFRPTLGLRFGDTLLLYYRDTNTPTRVTVPRTYGTVRHRRARSIRKQVVPKTRYHLLDEDDNE